MALNCHDERMALQIVAVDAKLNRGPKGATTPGESEANVPSLYACLQAMHGICQPAVSWVDARLGGA